MCWGKRRKEKIDRVLVLDILCPVCHLLKMKSLGLRDVKRISQLLTSLSGEVWISARLWLGSAICLQYSSCSELGKGALPAPRPDCLLTVPPPWVHQDLCLSTSLVCLPRAGQVKEVLREHECPSVSCWNCGSSQCLPQHLVQCALVVDTLEVFLQ